jgi:hypothetical protein
MSDFYSPQRYSALSAKLICFNRLKLLREVRSTATSHHAASARVGVGKQFLSSKRKTDCQAKSNSRAVYLYSPSSAGALRIAGGKGSRQGSTRQRRGPLANVPSAARVAAGAFGFLTLIQAPEGYRYLTVSVIVAWHWTHLKVRLS